MRNSNAARSKASLLVLTVVVLASTVCVHDVCGQAVVIQPQEAAPRISLQQRIFEIHRPQSFELEFAFNAAQEAIAEERWPDAVDRLQSIIDAQEDAYRPPTEVLFKKRLPSSEPAPGNADGNAYDAAGEYAEEYGETYGGPAGGPETRSAFKRILADAGSATTWKSAAAVALSTLPEAGRKAYMERYQPAAAAALTAAGDDLMARRRAALRYRWTTLGRNEVLRIATLDLDNGRAADALNLLTQLSLTDDGADDNGADRELLDRFAIAAETVQNASSPAVADWLTPGGGNTGVATNTDVAVTTPPAWRQSLIDEYDMGEAVEQFETALTEAFAYLTRARRGQAPYRLAVEPIIVGDTVVYAGLGRVEAYDLTTGSLRWRSALPDQTLRYLTKRLIGNSRQNDKSRVIWLMQRLVADRTGGLMSSDGRNAYVIIDQGASVFSNDTSATNSPHPLTPHKFNRLVCIDVESGLIRWWVGGPSSGAAAQPLANVYFLGPPVFVAGQLHVLGELGGQVRLFAIDRESGTEDAAITVWTPDPTGNRSEDVSMAGRGVMPLVSGSTLVCPLKDAVVAVDVLTRQILWTSPRTPGYQLARDNDRVSTSDEAIWASTALQQGLAAYPNAVLSGDRVFGLGANARFSLDLLTGEAAWYQPRQDELWIETVWDDVIVFATLSGLRGVDRQTGNTRWERRVSSVAGGGLMRGGRLTIPLQTNEIATIDLADGRLIAQTPSDVPLGTLVSGNGQMASFNGRELVALRPWEKPTSDDVPDSLSAEERAAWIVAGAEALHRDEGRRAIDILNQVARSDDADSLRLRTLLASAAIAAQEAAPATSFDVARNLDLDGLPAATAAALRRLRVESFAAEGDRLGEAREHIALITLGPSPTTRQISPTHLLNERQLSVAALQRLAREMTPDEQAASKIWFEGYLPMVAPANVKHLADAVPHDLLSDATAVTLAVEAQPASRKEALLWRLLEGSSVVGPPHQNEVALALCRLYEKAGRGHDLADAVDYLDPDDSDAAAFLERRAVTSLLSRLPAWSDGSIDVVRRDVNSQGDGFQVLKAFHNGRTSKSLPVMKSSPQGRDYALFTREGSRVESFAAAGALVYSMGRVQYVERLGHLAVVATIGRAEIYDTLPHPPQRIGVLPTFPAGNPRGILSMRFTGMGMKTGLAIDNQGQRFGTVGPLTRRCLTYVKDDRLIAVDPFLPTAPPLWEVGGITPGSELFGDDEIILVKEPEGLTLRGFRPVNGEEVDVAAMPAGVVLDSELGDHSNVLVGRQLLHLDADAASVRLSLSDPITGKETWSLRRPVNDRLERFGDYVLAANPGSGDVSIYDVHTGDELVSTTTRPLTEANYYLTSDANAVYLVTAEPMTEIVPELGPSTRFGLPLRGTESVPANGPLIAFDRASGDELWRSDVSEQQLLLEQPNSWPFLAFAANAVMPKEEGSTEVRRFMTVTLLSRFSGQTLWESDELPYELRMDWAPKPGRSTGTTLRTPSFQLTVRSAGAEDFPPDQPTDPDADERGADERGAGQAPAGVPKPAGIKRIEDALGIE